MLKALPLTPNGNKSKRKPHAEPTKKPVPEPHMSLPRINMVGSTARLHTMAPIKPKTNPKAMGILLPILSESSPEGSSRKALIMKKLETTTPTIASDAPNSLAYKGKNGTVIPNPKATKNTERHNKKNTLGYIILELTNGVTYN